MSPEFLVTCLIVVIAPGTGVLYTLAMALKEGSRAAWIASFACTLGILPSLLAAIFGLAAVLHTSATAFQVVKIAGVIFLLYLAWSTLRDKGGLSLEVEQAEGRSDRATATRSSFLSIMTKGILLNALNPKLSIFFLAFLPQFLSADRVEGSWQATQEMALLGAVFMAMTFVVFLGYGLFAATLRQHVITKPKVVAWMRRIFAGTFVALGARLALTER
ncbi:LysE family translocator [Rhodovibrionaceae bacterium A322]